MNELLQNGYFLEANPIMLVFCWHELIVFIAFKGIGHIDSGFESMFWHGMHNITGLTNNLLFCHLKSHSNLRGGHLVGRSVTSVEIP